MKKKTWVVMRSDSEVVVVNPKKNPEKCSLGERFYAGYSFDNVSKALAIWNAAKSEDEDLPDLLQEAAELIADRDPMPGTVAYELVEKIQKRLKIFDGRELDLLDEENNLFSYKTS